MRGRRADWRRVVLDAWPLLLALVLCLPLLTRGGHPLARDLIFVPRQPWTDAVVGLDDSAPRAVPLDAVVSLLTQVVDGGVLARVVIPLIIATAGWGAHRLVRDLHLAARLTAAGFAVWNPYVVERLALGQWALLAGYAALPWLVMAAAAYRRGRVGELGAVAGWLGLASLTPSGGLIAAVTAVACGSVRGLRTVPLVLVAAVLQLPWLAPSLVGTAVLTSDPAGVRAFAADVEGPGGVLTALVGLGGIWDARSVPASRESWWSVAAAVVAVAVLVVGVRCLVRTWGRATCLRLGCLAAACFVVAVLPNVPPGESLVELVVEEVPGGGLLRDSQKFISTYVVLVVAALGATVHVVVTRVASTHRALVPTVAVVAVQAPVVLLPDATVTTWPTLEPVRYPDGLASAAAFVDDDGGTLATLPWRSYRAFSWGNGQVSSDPAVRWFDTDVLVSEDLLVGSTVVAGESRRAQALGEDLARGPTVDALRENDVTWALVYRDDPAADELDLGGLTPVHQDQHLALYQVTRPAPAGPGPSAAQRATVVAADVLAVLTMTGGIAAATLRRRSRTQETESLLR